MWSLFVIKQRKYLIYLSLVKVAYPSVYQGKNLNFKVFNGHFKLTIITIIEIGAEVGF